MRLRASICLRRGYRTVQRWLSGPVAITPGTPRARRVELAGIALLCTTAVLFASVDAVAKLLSSNMPPIQIVWARFFFFWLLLIVVMGPRRSLGMMRSGSPGPQVLRALLVLGSNALFMTALKYMPLADATVIMFIAPFLVTLLSVAFLGERLRLFMIVGTTGGFIGILVVLRPGQGLLSWYAFLPLGTAVFMALYQILTRYLSRATPASATLFQTTLYCTLMTSIMAWFSWVPPDPQTWALLLSSGAIYGVSQTTLILSFSMAAPNVLAPFMYVQLLGALLFDFALFAHVPDWSKLAGIAIVVCSGLYTVRHVRRG
jgi:drug/metabolite transporter (DMT)-like permease